ncbi:hypothetical protein OPQ81_009244 [Rhizoctonia solani]|nr:hypothetical protein OPQ81_009244 [Rhizoctonia solani]
MSKPQARDRDEDVLLMPPPSTSTSAAGPVLYYPEDDGHPLGQCLAPASSPPPRQPSVASTSRRPIFGRFSSTGPKRRSALDNIGYVPEDIPTPRITRPFSTAVTGGTRKRHRGLKISKVATTSLVRPASIQPAPSPSKPPSAKCSTDGDDHEYIVDSSDDDRPVRFNLPWQDAPRPSKVARTNNTSVRPDPLLSSSRVGITPSSKRRAVGITPARRSNLTAQVGIAPARTDISARRSSSGLQISSTPIHINLPRSQPALHLSLPASEASPFVSSPFRTHVVSQKLKPAVGPSRISELKNSGAPPSFSGAKRASSSTPISRAFSATGAKSAISLAGGHRAVSPSTGTKRAPGSKSTSPGAKRPRIATPSPPAGEVIIVVSSSGEEEEEDDTGRKEAERRPSPSPSLGEYRPTPAASARSRTGSASSDVVLVEPPSNGTLRRQSSHKEAPSLKAPFRRVSTPTGAPQPDPPSTPSPSRHSLSSEKQPKVTTGRLVKRVESGDSPSPQPIVGRRIGTGRRQRLRQETQETEQGPSSSTKHVELSSSSSKQTEDSTSRPTADRPSSRRERPSGPAKRSSPRRTSDMPPPRRAAPPRTTHSPSPPWTGKPLFRPPTTTASGLTPMRELSPGSTSVRPTPGPSRPRNIESSKPPESSKDKTSKSIEAKYAQIFGDEDGDDPLSSLYDEPTRTIFGPPQYLILPRAPPSESPGPSTILSYSHISSVPPPTVLSTSIAPPPRRLRMDCVLLPRASKATRRALERAERQKKVAPPSIEIPKEKKGKGKAKEQSFQSKSRSKSEYPSLETRASSSSTAGPAPAVKFLVIDPQLAESSHYPSLPPEIVDSPDKYCHCCRTRSGSGKLKMRCGSMTFRRKRGIPDTEAHECGMYWCQRCIAKHDIPFDPTLKNFKCPLCNGRCECDVCRRERGQEPLGRWAVKVVRVKPGKRTLDALARGRVASRSISSSLPVESNSTAGPSGSVGPSGSSSAAAGPSGSSNARRESSGASKAPVPADSTLEESSVGPESESSDTPPASALAPVPRRRSASGPTTWHGRRTPPPILRLRLASGGHVLSSSAHIFVKRGPSGGEQVSDSASEQTAGSSTPGRAHDSPEPPAPAESVHTEDELSVEGEEYIWEDRHQAFEGDYSAAGGASFLGADSGMFDLGIEHGSEDLGGGHFIPDTHGMGIVSSMGHLGVDLGPVGFDSESLGVEGAGHLSTASDTVHSTTEGEAETSVTSTVVDDASRDSTEPLNCPLAYPPSDSSSASHSDAPVEMHTVPGESPLRTITGTLDDHPPAQVLADTPAVGVPNDTSAEISQATLTRIFHESVQGFAEGETAPTEHDSGSTGPCQQSSKIDELKSAPEAPEPGQPRSTTPDLDEIRAAFSFGEASGNLEINSDLGQLHTEGTFETVPRISMGDGGDLTIHGSLQDISLFSAVMDCSDETCGITLSSSQTEPAPTVCGYLLDQPTPIPSHYLLDIEYLAIPELEDPESEPDLVLATDPESAKSTILETPSPQLDSDPGPNLAELHNLFEPSRNHQLRATHYLLPIEEKRAHTREILRSRFVQQAESVTRTTRSQARKSMVERSKLLRSKRCYGVPS